MTVSVRTIPGVVCASRWRALAFLALTPLGLSAQDAPEPRAAATPYLVLTTDVHANVDGGFDTGTAVAFLAELGVDLDMEALLGWRGATVHASGFAVANNDRFTGDLLGHYSEISNIAAFETVRLFRAHVEQSLREGDLTVKVGQLALDDDFMGSDQAALFMNAAFGPLSTESANLGSPIFPVGALGAFGRLAVSENAWLQAGVYDGDAGSEEGNRHGLDVHLSGDQGATVLVAAGRSITLGEHPGTLAAGGILSTGTFTDFGTGAEVDGSWSVYATLDQGLVSDQDGQRLGAFARAGVAPQGERMVVDQYLDGGLTARGLRPDHVVGLGAFWAHFSREFARAEASGDAPVRSAESGLELTYLLPIGSHGALQPDLQWIIRPQARAAESALVLGIRAQVGF